MSITVESVFGHEYFLCFYGVVVWYLFLIIIEKGKTHKPIDIKRWWKSNVLDVIATLAIAPLMIVFDDELVDFYNSIMEKDIVLGKLVYICAGPAYNLVMRLITGFIKK